MWHMCILAGQLMFVNFGEVHASNFNTEFEYRGRSFIFGEVNGEIHDCLCSFLRFVSGLNPFDCGDLKG